MFNYEVKTSYDIRVRTTDAGGLWAENTFTINVNNVNEAPTALALSANTINENAASGTAIGTFSSTDVDVGDTFTYSLVAGAGDTDNASFSIVSGELRSAAVFDYETKSSYSIRVRTTDAGGLNTENTFTINVNDILEAPTAPTSVAAATSTSGQTTVSWNASAGATSYDLYWRTTTGVTSGNGTQIAGVSSPYTHTGRADGTTYYYVVVASNGGGSSADSSQASATPMAAPSISVGAGVAQTSITWSGVTGASGYDLYFNSTGSVTTASTKIADVTSPYTHTSRVNGTTYYYRLEAKNASGTSSLSTEQSATPQAAPTISEITSSPSTGFHNEGDSITITVTFNQSVTLSSGGQLRITLDTGDQITVTGSPTTGTAFNFAYTVGAGDTSSDLDVTAVTLVSGTLQNGNSTAATLGLPAGEGLADNSSLVIDTTAPTVTIASGASNYINAANDQAYNLASGTCTIGEGNVTVYYDRTPSSTNETVACNAGSWTSGGVDLSGFSDGAVTITAEQTDAAGNSDSEATSATKDATAPTVDAGANFSVATATAPGASASDAGTGIASYAWSKTAGAGTITYAPNSTSVNPTFENDTDGAVTMQLTVTDVAGNSASDTVEFTWTGEGGGSSSSTSSSSTSSSSTSSGGSNSALVVTEPTLNGANVDFGTAYAHASGKKKYKTWTVYNSSSTATDSLSITVSDTTNYSIDTTLSTCDDTAELAATSDCTLVIAFGPTSAAVFTGTVSISATNNGNANYSRGITGEGLSASNPLSYYVGATANSGALAFASGGNMDTSYMTTGLNPANSVLSVMIKNTSSELTETSMAASLNSCTTGGLTIKSDHTTRDCLANGGGDDKNGTLPPGDYCFISVEWPNAAAIAAACQLHVSGTLQTSARQIDIDGTVANTDANIHVGRGGHHFGIVAPGDTSSTVTFTAKRTNSGGGSAVTAPVDNLTYFDLDQTGTLDCHQEDASLANGDTCNYVWKFVPPANASGQYSEVAALTIGSVTYYFTLQGYAGTSTPNVAITNADGNSLTSGYDFGYIPVDQGAGMVDYSATNYFAINNTGTAATSDLTVDVCVNSTCGATAGPFSVPTTCDGSLSIGGTCMVPVTFAPTTEADYSTTYTLKASWNSGASSTSVAIKGKAFAGDPYLVVTGPNDYVCDSFTCPTFSVGAGVQTKTLTMINYGLGAANSFTYTPSGNDFTGGEFCEDTFAGCTDTNASTCDGNTVLTNGETCTIVIDFDPVGSLNGPNFGGSGAEAKIAFQATGWNGGSARDLVLSGIGKTQGELVASSTFDVGSSQPETLSTMTWDSYASRWIIAGRQVVAQPNANTDIFVKAVNSDGSFDTSFGTPTAVLNITGAADYANAVVTNPTNGDIYVCGVTYNGASSDAQFAVLKVGTAGGTTLSTWYTYNPTVGGPDYCNGLVWKSGALYAIGSVNNADLVLVKINTSTGAAESGYPVILNSGGTDSIVVGGNNIAVASKTENYIYAIATWNGSKRVVKMDLSGTFIAQSSVAMTYNNNRGFTIGNWDGTEYIWVGSGSGTDTAIQRFSTGLTVASTTGQGCHGLTTTAGSDIGGGHGMANAYGLLVDNTNSVDSLYVVGITGTTYGAIRQFTMTTGGGAACVDNNGAGEDWDAAGTAGPPDKRHEVRAGTHETWTSVAQDSSNDILVGGCYSSIAASCTTSTTTDAQIIVRKYSGK